MMRAALVVLGGLVAIPGWMAAASWIWCVGTSRPFTLLAWWQAIGWWNANWWCKLWIIVGGAIPTLALLAVAYGVLTLWLRHRRRRLVPPSGGGLRPVAPGVSDNHGHAAWASHDQLAKRYGGGIGCLMGAADRGGQARLWFDSLATGPGHSMVIAGPGSDKSTTAITRIWHWKGPRVVFDPSLEIGPVMIPALVAAGFNVSSIGLANGHGVNVLDWIDVAHPEADAHIRSATDWIYNEGATARGSDGQRDPFWGQWGRALVTCLMAHMLYSATPGLPKTLATLRQGINIPEHDMQMLLRGVRVSSNSAMARDIAGGLMGMRAEETFSSIYSNAFAATEWMSVGAYADVVSGDAMRTADILDSNTVVFVQLPLRSLLATPAVARAVMGAFFNAMFHADGQGIADTILFQIDEAWILGALKEIKLCHTTARKYRGAVSTIWQSEGQIEGIWGREDAKMLRDTVSWRSYNAIQDGSIAETLSRDIGEHAVMAWSEGSNSGRSRNPGAMRRSRSTGDNSNQHEIKRRLIKADEILRAPADEMFVLARDFPHPIRCYSAPYWRIPELNRLMSANRFNRAAAE